MLVHVAEHDLLHDEGVLLAERLAAAGTEVQLVDHPGLWHVFHVHAGSLAEADVAVDATGAFLRTHLSAASYSPPHGPGASR